MGANKLVEKYPWLGKDIFGKEGPGANTSLAEGSSPKGPAHKSKGPESQLGEEYTRYPDDYTPKGHYPRNFDNLSVDEQMKILGSDKLLKTRLKNSLKLDSDVDIRQYLEEIKKPIARTFEFETESPKTGEAKPPAELKPVSKEPIPTNENPAPIHSEGRLSENRPHGVKQEYNQHLRVDEKPRVASNNYEGETYSRGDLKDILKIETTPKGNISVTPTTKSGQAITQGAAAMLRQAGKKPRDYYADKKGVILKSEDAKGIVTKEGHILMADVPFEDVEIDPERFQWRTLINDKGVEIGDSERAMGRKFDPEKSGLFVFWKDPADGKTYLVNGHHRRNWMVKSGEKRYPRGMLINVPTAEEARAYGATLNISEGNARTVDVATYIKETGISQEKAQEEGLKGKQVDDGIALSRLSPRLWNKYVKFELPESIGIAIGKKLPKQEDQEAVYDVLSKWKGKLSAEVVEEAINVVLNAPRQKSTQLDSFGEETFTQNLAFEKASLIVAVRGDLLKDKKILGAVSRSGWQDTLEKGGNIIDQEKSKELATESSQAEFIFSRLAHTAGPISDILNEGAKRIAAGEQVSQVKSDVIPAMKEALKGGGKLERREGTEAGGTAGREDIHQETLFEGNPSESSGRGTIGVEGNEVGAGQRQETSPRGSQETVEELGTRAGRGVKSDTPEPAETEIKDDKISTEELDASGIISPEELDALMRGEGEEEQAEKLPEELIRQKLSTGAIYEPEARSYFEDRNIPIAKTYSEGSIFVRNTDLEKARKAERRSPC